MTYTESVKAWHNLLVTTSNKKRPMSDGHACATSTYEVEYGHGSILGEGAHISDKVFKQLGISGHIQI